MQRHSSRTARRLPRLGSVGATLLRVGMTLWFIVLSLGLPALVTLGPSGAGGTCALRPGQDCRCSLKKKLSGSCCCHLDSATNSKEVAASEAVARKSREQQSAKTSATRSCCASKAEQTDAKPEKGIARSGCSCRSDSEFEVMLQHVLALPVEHCEPFLIAIDELPIAANSARWPSVRHAPPEPPPRRV